MLSEMLHTARSSASGYPDLAVREVPEEWFNILQSFHNRWISYPVIGVHQYIRGLGVTVRKAKMFSTVLAHRDAASEVRAIRLAVTMCGFPCCFRNGWRSEKAAITVFSNGRLAIKVWIVRVSEVSLFGIPAQHCKSTSTSYRR